jgi:hypothetical protein
MPRCANIHFKNITRKGKYNLHADEKLEKLLEDNIEFGFWGAADSLVAHRSRTLKKMFGGRMRDHQRVVARQLIAEIRRDKVRGMIPVYAARKGLFQIPRHTNGNGSARVEPVTWYPSLIQK